MLVGILKPFYGAYRSMIDVYKQILDYNDIKYIDLDINDPDFWSDVKRIDLFLAKFAQFDDELKVMLTILPIISEFMGIPCFPNFRTAWHYDDKVRQFYLLKQFNVPVIESYVFWEKKKALKWVDSTNFPVIFKLKNGSGSSNVTLVKNKVKAKKVIRKSFGAGIHPYWYDLFGKLGALNYNYKKISKYMLKPFVNKFIRDIEKYPNYAVHKNYVYFQKFMPNNEYDTRVAIVGKRAWAFKRMNRPNDFRASGSNNYDIRRNSIDMEIVKIAFDISLQLGFQSMAYDFVYDENRNPVLIEISYTYGDYPEFSTGYWDTDLVWHDGKFIPEYLELVDALNLPDLKQPDIEIKSPYKKALMKS